MAVKIDTHNLEGKVTGSVTLPAELFEVQVDPGLLAMALRVYQANQRQATSKVKTRGEINRTTRKAWKQKGTGRARHGARSAPIFVGGGVAHGPSGNQNFSLKLTKRTRQQALKGALSLAASDGRIMIVEGLQDLATSTKALDSTLKALNADTARTLIMIESPLRNVIGAGGNLKNVTVTQAKRTNIFELLVAHKIIVHKPALIALAENFGSKAEAAAPVETKQAAAKVDTKKPAPKQTAAKVETKKPAPKKAAAKKETAS
jgi:large subunit ribosomal protein L4